MAKDKEFAISSMNITSVQEKYGVVLSPSISQDQPAYGVPLVQPAYGVVPVQPTTDINITYDQLEEMISTLKKATSRLKDSWSNETQKNLATLENSWVGNDCRAYTNRVRHMDGNVQNTIEALELLTTTYEKARDMVQDTQKNTMAAITSNE